MRLPLQYQISEYDCGPTSLRNALMYLIPREEMPQELLIMINRLSLDGYHPHGTEMRMSTFGTSDDAMMRFSDCFNVIANQHEMSLRSDVLLDDSLRTDNSILREALSKQGAVVSKVIMEVPHYVLLTGLHASRIQLFDPYPTDDPVPASRASVTGEHPYDYNVEVERSCMDRVDDHLWSFGPVYQRIALVFRRMAA